MNDRNKTLLLQLIYAKAEIDALLKRGLTIGQISRMLMQVIEEGMAKCEGSTLILTPLGKERISQSDQEGRRRRDGGWISEDESSKIPRKSINKFLLPRKGSSFFST